MQNIKKYIIKILPITMVIALLIISVNTPIMKSKAYEYTPLNVVIYSNSHIKLEWDNVPTSASYLRVERKVGSGNFQTVSTVSANMKSVFNYGLTSGYVYTYRLSSVDSNGTATVISSELSFMTNSVKTPQSLEINSISSTSIKLEWEFPDMSLYPVVIERRNPEQNIPWQVVHQSDRHTKTYEDTELSPNTMYHYRIRSIFNSDIHSTYYPSSYITVRTLLPAPYNVEGLVISDNQILLEWEYEFDNTTGFIIEKSVNGEEYEIAAYLSSDHIIWLDSSLVQGSLYSYRIKSYNTYNESHYTEPINITCIYITPPADLEAHVMDTSGIKLEWIDNVNVEGEFELYRKVISETDWELIAVLPRHTRSYIDNNVSKGQIYDYKTRVSVDYRNASSAFSNTASVRSLALSPPSNLQSLLINPSVLRLTWDHSLSQPNAYYIERKRSSDDVWQRIGTLSPSLRLHVDTSFTPKTLYQYRITAYNKSLDTYIKRGS